MWRTSNRTRIKSVSTPNILHRPPPNRPLPPTPRDLFFYKSALFQATRAGAITRLIVIDAFDGVGLLAFAIEELARGRGASASRGERAQTARTAAPVVYQSREEKKRNKQQTGCPARAAAPFK